MPLRQPLRISTTLLETQPNRKCSLQPALSALTCFAVLLCLATMSFAQSTSQTSQTKTPPDAPSASQTGAAPAGIPGSDTFNLLQKKSLFFPNIATSTERLTTGGKFKLFVDNSISLSAITWAAASSGISQAADSPTGYEQGWDAYGKRFGSYMARNASSEFFGTFLFASALHEDPRFFPDQNPSLGHAIKYSVKALFVTRNDDGKNVANISGLAGPLAAEGLANVYWPDRNRTVGDTFMRYGLDLATQAGGNLFREYWPVVYGKIHHSSQSTASHN